MLEALLRGKLRTGAVDDDEGSATTSGDLASREDPLTASVFERLSRMRVLESRGLRATQPSASGSSSKFHTRLQATTGASTSATKAR